MIYMIIKNKFNRGFIGLLILLISITIITFFIIRTDLFTGQKDGKNMIQSGKEAVDEAKAAKNLMEQDSKKAIGE